MKRRAALWLSLSVVGVVAVVSGGCPAGPGLFTVYPLAIDFGTILTQDTVFLSNAGSTPVSWSVSSVPAWVSVAPLSGITTGGVDTLTVTVLDRTLADPDNDEFFIINTVGAGDFKVFVTAGVPGTDPGDVDPGDEPQIELIDSLGARGLSATVQTGSGGQGTFQVANTGTGSLEWYIPADAYANRPAWITGLSATGGLVGTNPQTITVTTEATPDLVVGTNPHVFPIQSNGGTAELTVTIVRKVQSLIGVDPSSLNFGQSLTSATLFVYNLGVVGSNLNFRVLSNEPWLMVTPSIGVSIGTSPVGLDRIPLQVTVDRSCIEDDAAGGVLTVEAYTMRGTELVKDPGVQEVLVPVSLEAPDITIDAAGPWGVPPSLLRYTFILRDRLQRPLLLPDPAFFGENQLTVFEDSKPIEIVETNQEVTTDYRTNLLIMLDYSNSMVAAAGSSANLHQYYRDAVINRIIDNTAELPDASDPDNQVAIAILAFYDRHLTEAELVVQDFTTDRNALRTAMQNFTAPRHGATELLPVADYAIFRQITQDTIFDKYNNATIDAVLVISDGRETTPPGELSETIQAAEKSSTRFFNIGWGNGVDDAFLTLLASESEGFYYAGVGACSGDPTVEGPTFDQLDNAVQYFVTDLASHYVLSYTTLNEKSSAVVRLEASIEVDDGDPEVENEVLRGTSPNYILDLSMIAAGTPQTIEVIEPNGGEVYSAGSTVRVTWDSSPLITTVSILASTGGVNTPIATNIPNVEFFDWTIPGGQAPADDYKITVFASVGGQDVVDQSDQPFSIIALP
jgi:hypothetical protein